VQAVKINPPTELRIWEKVCIIAGEGRDAGVYEARVEDIINGGILVSNPEFISGHTLLRNDLPAVVQFTREDAAYQFHSRVRMQNSDNLRRVILTPPKTFMRVQRRAFARVECPLRVLYASAPSDGKWKDWETSNIWEEARSVDISVGGMLLKMPAKLATGSVLFLRIYDLFPGEGPCELMAVCRRSHETEGQAYAGFEFVTSNDISQALTKLGVPRIPDKYRAFDRRAQDRLANLLFQKQIELRQKGLI
jgi:c-di-GMP-binding flagellar brake protein YcgR